MSVEQEIEILPALLVEAMLAHRFFDANNIKKRQEELRSWVNMNSAIIGGDYRRK